MLKYILIFSLLLTSCGKKPELETGLENISLKPMAFSDLEGWKNDNLNEVFPALVYSCDAILKKDSDSKLDSSLIEQKVDVWQKLCKDIKELQPEDVAIRTYFEKYFQPYTIIDNDASETKTGVFTGYYEASLNGSFKKTEKYKYPLYGQPKDMIFFNPAQFNQNLVNTELFGRVENQRLVPYFTREDIEKKGIEAPVVLWVDDPVDAFILHIQGSGIATLPDGKTVRVGYAGNNGHGFIGIGSIMTKDGLLKPGEASMVHIRDWLRKNPKEAEELMARNPRYIFFRTYEGEGPLGAQKVPLTAKRSLAVDRRYIPLGLPLWLNTVDPDGNKMNKMVVAQDVGSAIKGSVRGDFFWGYGDEAFYNAGRMKSSGTYYVILPK
ncbi:MAG: murein transglycosylase A [Alphaproteobacteria bacterium]